MEKFFSAELLREQWPVLVPVMLLSMAVGWWLRGGVTREMASLRKMNAVLQQHLNRAQENEAAQTLVGASLQADLGDLKDQIRRLQERMPDDPEVKKLRLPAQSSPIRVANVSEAICRMRQLLEQHEARKAGSATKQEGSSPNELGSI